MNLSKLWHVCWIEEKRHLFMFFHLEIASFDHELKWKEYHVFVFWCPFSSKWMNPSHSLFFYHSKLSMSNVWLYTFVISCAKPGSSFRSLALWIECTSICGLVFLAIKMSFWSTKKKILLQCFHISITLLI